MTQEPLSVRINRVFKAPIELVYEAWTSAEHVVHWMKCSRDVRLTVEGWEPRVGARFTTHMVKL